MIKITELDHSILVALSMYDTFTPSFTVGVKARLHTSSIKETAARHLIKLTKLGLAEKGGTPMFPAWRITAVGRATLKELAK